MNPFHLPSRLIIALFLGTVLSCADAQAGMILSPVIGEGVTAGCSSLSIDFYGSDEEEAEQYRAGAGMQPVLLDDADQPVSGGILAPVSRFAHTALSSVLSLTDERSLEVTFSIESPPS